MRKITVVGYIIGKANYVVMVSKSTYQVTLPTQYMQASIEAPWQLVMDTGITVVQYSMSSSKVLTIYVTVTVQWGYPEFDRGV